MPVQAAPFVHTLSGLLLEATYQQQNNMSFKLCPANTNNSVQAVKILVPCQRWRCFKARAVPLSLSFSLVALTPPSAPSGGPNSAVRVNSHGAKIKPATVKWPSNAIAVLNGTVICSQWGKGRELLISLTGSQMKITGPIMVWAVISGFTLLHAKDLGCFFPPPLFLMGVR